MKAITLALILLTSALAHSESEKTSTCRLFAVPRGDLEQIKQTNQDIQSLSSSVNEALKSSHALLNKVDHATLGLVSAYLLGGGRSLDQIEPNEWGKARFVGALVYQDQPFSMTALRGVSIKITDQNKKSWTLTTGSHGEFSMPFYELIPYQRLRLFGGITLEKGNKFRQTIKVPLQIEVQSSLCNASLKIHELPLEPMTLIASGSEI